MTSIDDYSYSKEGVQQIAEWPYGKNWPIVYIAYNDKTAYIGETLDAVRRTEQHMQEPGFDVFTQICLISNRTYNKSVILDLESFLIKYMSAEGSKKLANGNAGILDHNYFYREAYADEFKEIWIKLIDKGIVHKSLVDIENSEMYKFSPYKTLNAEQQKTAYEIIKWLSEINNAKSQSMITVVGGAGTGKTVLAVFLVKLLQDIIIGKKVWNAIGDTEDAILLQKIKNEIDGIKKIGLVVPMAELRNTIKEIFRSIDGLNESMVLAPEEAVKSYYDVLICDEAHRLYRRKHLPGQHLYKKFDQINRAIMADAFTGTEQDDTELDWLIKSSRLQVLFYDEHQAIRATDIGAQRFENICKPHLYRYLELFSQMRCKGGSGYYEYVRDIIEGNDTLRHKVIPGYETKVFDDISNLFDAILQKEKEYKLCRVVTGPGWKKDEDIIIDGKQYKWSDKADDTNVVFSIHKIQGFDLNYAGVIFGKEVYYDETTKRIAVMKKELEDNHTKSDGDENMRRFVLNIYTTLMTRGIEGTYVYAVDKQLREYLRTFLG